MSCLELNGFDLNINAARQIKSLKRLNRSIGQIMNIQQAVMNAQFKMLHGFLINVRTANNAEFANLGRQGDRPTDSRTRALAGLANLQSRLIQNSVIISPDSNSYCW